MRFMSGATSFYVPRFPPGIAEAGFFPGVMYYLTTWLPDSARRRAGALVLGGSATAYIVTGPISGALLEMRGLGGFAGWRWMFAREGALSITVVLVAAFFLVSRIQDAR
ncbi:MFS transporter [Streptomyces mordarskii]